MKFTALIWFTWNEEKLKHRQSVKEGKTLMDRSFAFFPFPLPRRNFFFRRCCCHRRRQFHFFVISLCFFLHARCVDIFFLFACLRRIDEYFQDDVCAFCTVHRRNPLGFQLFSSSLNCVFFFPLL